MDGFWYGNSVESEWKRKILCVCVHYYKIWKKIDDFRYGNGEKDEGQLRIMGVHSGKN